jgi:hypothetical protein
MRDRQFQRLRQEHRDAVAALEAVRFEHIGKAAREFGNLVERGGDRSAVFIDIDQREPAASVGMAIAAGGRKVKAIRNIPAKVAVEFCVVGGFGEHFPRLDDRRAGIKGGQGRNSAPPAEIYRSCFLGLALASDFSPLNTDLHPLLSCEYCLCMHAVMRSTSGTSALHSRMASSLQSRCCSAV